MKVSELMDLLDTMPSDYDVIFAEGDQRKELDYMVNCDTNCVIFIKEDEE